MKKQTFLKLGAIATVATVIVYLLKLVQGWEVPMFAILTFVLFYFSLFFVQYVDDQKSMNSSDSQIGDHNAE